MPTKAYYTVRRIDRVTGDKQEIHTPDFRDAVRRSTEWTLAKDKKTGKRKYTVEIDDPRDVEQHKEDTSQYPT